MQELRQALQTAQDGIPAWQIEVRQTLATLGERLVEDAQRWQQRLEALGSRVEEALQRLALLGPHLPDDLAAAISWAAQALDYLHRRRSSGVDSPCPLPELFAALGAGRPDFSISAFHDGLRRLQERRALILLPWDDPSSEMPQPEYALFDAGKVMYFATGEPRR